MPRYWFAFILLFALIAFCRDCVALCRFPHFMRAPLPDGSRRYWITHTLFSDNTDNLNNQHEIRVQDDVITTKIKMKSQCKDLTGDPYSCFHHTLIHQETCLYDEGEGLYRVMREEKGRYHYSCVKFVPRNRNVVQVWNGQWVETDSSNLCHDQELQRQEWPWTSPVQEEWSPCPLVGGFDFKTFVSINKERLCKDMWRPSRLESECVLGEGLKFTFPEDSCSPFQDNVSEIQLFCWASWVEDRYIFIMASQPEKIPHFVLRLPWDYSQLSEFTTHLYFNPICPVSKTGTPVERINVRHFELKMNRGESGLCYDESELCSQYAHAGRCTNSALYKYANYCKKSCGLCKLLPSTWPECQFPEEYEKKWLLFDNSGQQEIEAKDGRVKSSNLGTFICKSKHWAKSQYKVLSHYNNGCRPRYSCIHFQQPTENMLDFQISKSDLTDKSFDLCKFEDDPPPLGGRIHSLQLKHLIPQDRVRSNACGLRGVAEVSMKYHDRKGFPVQCHGTMSDWNSDTCHIEPLLKLKPGKDCSSDFPRHAAESTCVAYITLEEGYSLLITKQNGRTGRHVCWVIITYAERMGHRPWQEAHLLNTAQCGSESDLDPTFLQGAVISVKTRNDYIRKPCHPSRYATGPPGRSSFETSPKEESKASLMRKEKFIKYSQVSGESISMKNTPSFILCAVFLSTVILVVNQTS